jgi:hypothetical protein
VSIRDAVRAWGSNVVSVRRGDTGKGSMTDLRKDPDDRGTKRKGVKEPRRDTIKRTRSTKDKAVLRTPGLQRRGRPTRRAEKSPLRPRLRPTGLRSRRLHRERQSDLRGRREILNSVQEKGLTLRSRGLPRRQVRIMNALPGEPMPCTKPAATEARMRFSTGWRPNANCAITRMTVRARIDGQC